APTGIGKTIGTLFPALRAMPRRAVDKVFFLTAKTPGRQVALDALQRVRAANGEGAVLPLRVLELVAKEKACEYRGKACHGDACPLAKGFYDRLPAARSAAAEVGWLDQHGLRAVALAHSVCPYYLGQEMVRWSDVVVGDYNYYFDRSALLHALVVEASWRVSVLVDEAHNLIPRARSMYSADLTRAEAISVRLLSPAGVRARLDDWLDQWQLLLPAPAPDRAPAGWSVLDDLPPAWLRALQRLNSAIGEQLQQQSAQAEGALLPFYFRTLAFATLAEVFGEHSLCELDAAQCAGQITLRNVIPSDFIAQRIKTADAMVLFSATLNPPDYYTSLLGLPAETRWLDVASPFAPQQLQVSIQPISTRRARRSHSLNGLVHSIAAQYTVQPGNYLAFFSSHDYLELAFNALCVSHPSIPAWAQERQMDEPARRQFLQQFDAAGRGIGFAVLGGVFAEGVDLPGKRLIGAFVATLGLPPFDPVNAAICERLQQQFGRGHDYTYVVPGLQKVVQAAGRVIRSGSDTGTLMLLDERYLEPRYQALLPSWWRIGPSS
ncbi:MAG: ATP-dependent DNA helicase, partial [Burkholderiaceae bacterium]